MSTIRASVRPVRWVIAAVILSLMTLVIPGNGHSASAGGAPDLTVTIVPLNEPFVAGGLAAFFVFISNEGNADATAFDVRFSLTGVRIPPVVTGNCTVLNVGSDKFSAECQFPGGLPPGSAFVIGADIETESAGSLGLRVVADPRGDVIESREDNNVDERAFPVIAQADLVASIVPDSGPLAGKGTMAAFTVAVANEGISSATGVSVRVKITGGVPVKILAVFPVGPKGKCTKISDSEFKCTVNRVFAGQSLPFHVVVKQTGTPVEEMTGSLQATASADGASNELDFSDNVASAPLAVS